VRFVDTLRSILLGKEDRVKRIKRFGVWFLVMVTLVAGCASPSPATPGAVSNAATDGQVAVTPKRITAAIQGDPHTLVHRLNPSSRVRGIEALEQMAHAGLTTPDNQGGTVPQLAEAVPSTDNGLWVLQTDGRMSTTWQIREGVQWQDGTPFTSSDLLFTWQVVRDPALILFGEQSYEWIERVDAPDPRSITVHWSQPYIEADAMFSYIRALPMPRHLLEKAYQDDKATFLDHPYWSTEFVGLGPYKVKEWVRGSHMVFEPYDRYTLGRPKIDVVEVRFILDDATLMANLLAGSVELTLGRNLAGEQAFTLRDQWKEGHMDLGFDSWIALYPQLLNPTPSLVADGRFRRAILHAIDRQSLVDVLLRGTSVVADSFMSPNQPEYKQIEERNVVRYPYDSRKAMEMLDGLGLTKGPDGFYRDPTGQRLTIEVRTTDGDDLREKSMLSIQNNWQQIGVSMEAVIIPRQRASDLEYRANYPAFEIVRQPNDVRGLRTLHSRYASLPENNYRGTGNRSRYFNAEFDGWLDRYFTTIPKAERNQILTQIVHHISDQLIILGLLYNASPTLVSNRLVNVTAGREGATQAWNAHQWDVK
jgi:peptide/nickel transport system substrate-binding protein